MLNSWRFWTRYSTSWTTFSRWYSWSRPSCVWWPWASFATFEKSTLRTLWCFFKSWLLLINFLFDLFKMESAGHHHRHLVNRRHLVRQIEQQISHTNQSNYYSSHEGAEDCSRYVQSRPERLTQLVGQIWAPKCSFQFSSSSRWPKASGHCWTLSFRLCHRLATWAYSSSSCSSYSRFWEWSSLES